MVKPIALTIVSAILFPTLTIAAACTDGLVYCGYNLLRRGKISPNGLGASLKTTLVLTLET
jgi:hypothetical protein